MPPSSTAAAYTPVAAAALVVMWVTTTLVRYLNGRTILSGLPRDISSLVAIVTTIYYILVYGFGFVTIALFGFITSEGLAKHVLSKVCS